MRWARPSSCGGIVPCVLSHFSMPFLTTLPLTKGQYSDDSGRTSCRRTRVYTTSDRGPGLQTPLSALRPQVRQRLLLFPRNRPPKHAQIPRPQPRPSRDSRQVQARTSKISVSTSSLRCFQSSSVSGAVHCQKSAQRDRPLLQLSHIRRRDLFRRRPARRGVWELAQNGRIPRTAPSLPLTWLRCRKLNLPLNPSRPQKTHCTGST